MAKARSDTGPFSQVPHWLLKQRPSANAVLVYAHLGVFADFNGSGTCWPARATLAKRTGLSPATVDRAMAELRAFGALDRESGKAKGQTTVYIVHRTPPEGASWVSDPWITDDAGGASRVTHRTRTTERDRSKTSRDVTSDGPPVDDPLPDDATVGDIRAHRARHRSRAS